MAKFKSLFFRSRFKVTFQPSMPPPPPPPHPSCTFWSTPTTMDYSKLAGTPKDSEIPVV